MSHDYRFGRRLKTLCEGGANFSLPPPPVVLPLNPGITLNSRIYFLYILYCIPDDCFNAATDCPMCGRAYIGTTGLPMTIARHRVDDLLYTILHKDLVRTSILQAY